jgi:hypothetical protein
VEFGGSAWLSVGTDTLVCRNLNVSSVLLRIVAPLLNSCKVSYRIGSLLEGHSEPTTLSFGN